MGKRQISENGSIAESHSGDARKYDVLILGASYGSLLATKILLSGHNATLICRETTAALFNSSGSVVRMPIKARDSLVEIHSNDLAGNLIASQPDGVDPGAYDLVVLAMQEPQYSASAVRELVGRIAASQVPSDGGHEYAACCRTSSVSRDSILIGCVACFFRRLRYGMSFDPELLTLCSPDPQAFRPPEEKPNILEVRLATNFKVARFVSQAHTQMLLQLEQDIEAARFDLGDGDLIEVAVKLRVHESIFVPLAKWAMLMTGNYRCVQPDQMRPIKDAVHGNIEASRAVYDWVVNLCIDLGGQASDFVPFEKYAKAANSLASPSSAARALAGGAQAIERVDKLVALIAAQKGVQLDAIDATVGMVDDWLTRQSGSQSRQEA